MEKGIIRGLGNKYEKQGEKYAKGEEVKQLWSEELSSNVFYIVNNANSLDFFHIGILFFCIQLKI